MFQMKEQYKSDVEIGNLPEKEFKVMIVKMIKKLGRRMVEQSEKLEVFNKELEDIKNNQTEVKNTITEMKTSTEGISRLNYTEEQISELEERVVENTEAEHSKEKRGQLKRPLRQHQAY